MVGWNSSYYEKCYYSSITSGSYYSQAFGFVLGFFVFFSLKKTQHQTVPDLQRVKTLLIDFVCLFSFWVIYVFVLKFHWFCVFSYYLVNLQAWVVFQILWFSLIVSHSQLFWVVIACVWLVTLLVLILYLLEGWNEIPACFSAGTCKA